MHEIHLTDGHTEIIWPSNYISTPELEACFPDCSGLVLIHSKTRKAVRAVDGVLVLQSGEHYTVPIPKGK
jgi:hypothetical protein